MVPASFILSCPLLLRRRSQSRGSNASHNAESAFSVSSACEYGPRSSGGMRFSKSEINAKPLPNLAYGLAPPFKQVDASQAGS